MLIVSSEVREVDCLQSETFSFFYLVTFFINDSRWVLRIKKK
jgi:hypothetical protein